MIKIVGDVSHDFRVICALAESRNSKRSVASSDGIFVDEPSRERVEKCFVDSSVVRDDETERFQGVPSYRGLGVVCEADEGLGSGDGTGPDVT